MTEDKTWQKRTSTETKRYELFRNIEAQIDLAKLSGFNQYVKNSEPGSRYLAHVKCKCGQMFDILKANFVVDFDGAVWPVIYHEQCGFNEWAKFTEWSLKVELIATTKEFCPYCRGNIQEHDSKECEKEVIMWRNQKKVKKVKISV